MRVPPTHLLASARLPEQLVWLAGDPKGVRLKDVGGGRIVVELEDCGGWGRSLAQAIESALRQATAIRRPGRHLQVVG